MTGTLADRVAAWVADHPGQTAFAVARAVRGRDTTVTEILNGPLFVSEPLNRWASDRARGYRLAGSEAGQGAEGRSRRNGTHKQRVLELLKDGRPHSHMDGYRLGVMLHSRVADLRRDGYRIACWREGDLYMYRLEPGSSSDEPHVAMTGFEGETCGSSELDSGPTLTTPNARPSPGPESTYSTGEPSTPETPAPQDASPAEERRTDGPAVVVERTSLPSDGASPVDSQLSLLPPVGAHGRAA